MSEAQLLERIDKMASAMQLMASMLGTRLDRAQLAERFGVCRNTLRSRMEKYKDFPHPAAMMVRTWCVCAGCRDSRQVALAIAGKLSGTPAHTDF